VKVFPAFSAVNCVAFSPDRSLAACGCDDASVRLWDLAAGSPPPSFSRSDVAIGQYLCTPSYFPGEGFGGGGCQGGSPLSTDFVR